MAGYLALVLHAHLPYVRHPEQPKYLEESWLYEAVAESYLPLLEVFEGWRRDRLPVRLTCSLSPTLCAMLRDELLRRRCGRYLAGLVALAEQETFRTHWEPAFGSLAEGYHRRFIRLTELWQQYDGDLVGAFARLEQAGLLELVTCAATHAVLPLLAGHPPAVRAQVRVACDQHRTCFGRGPSGFWLPECAYSAEIEPALREAGLGWFITDTHGLLHASPRPVFGTYAPVATPGRLAAFGRDLESAKQVWSRHEGYPGDPRYRDFYRDVGFDLDLDYVKPYLPSPDHRGFTGIKYHRIGSGQGGKEAYDRAAALEAVRQHASHFLDARQQQLERLTRLLPHPPLVVAPYDAELFGHWWHEGPEFLDTLVRLGLQHQAGIAFLTPSDYLRRHPTLQTAQPSPSSWGEEGYWRTWLNETNSWVLRHLRVAQERMTELARRFPEADGLMARALRQAARELLLAQASDWPFMLNAGASPAYARRRVQGHLLAFTELYEQLVSGHPRLASVQPLEARDNLFPAIDYHHWA